MILLQVWTEEGEEESEMTCSERLQAELQDDPGGGPPLIPLDPPEPPASPREQDLTGIWCQDKCVGKKLPLWIQFVRYPIHFLCLSMMSLMRPQRHLSPVMSQNSIPSCKMWNSTTELDNCVRWENQLLIFKFCDRLYIAFAKHQSTRWAEFWQLHFLKYHVYFKLQIFYCVISIVILGKSEPSGSPYTPPGFLSIPYPGYPPPPHLVSHSWTQLIN